MAQSAKKISLDRTYLPIDPNTLTQTMHDTAGEDKPEERIPVIPYEGWNFMPTGYGWRSYFGLNSSLGIDSLPDPAKCRELFTFQKSDLTHILIALCDNGIYTKAGESAGAWTKEINLADPGTGVLKEWSKVILENTLYVYRQGDANAYKLASPGFTFVAHTPNTLNMSGQLGIFKAGNRLGFWDSADAIGVSAFVDFTDFAPSIATLANIFTIKDKIGKIINILQHGDGWIVYATKSIIAVRRDPSNSFLWKASSISNVAGIAYRNQACMGSPDTEHFAWTSIGLMRIRNFEAEILTPELYDYLKETQIPVYLKIIEGRYLSVQLADAKYVDGILSFYTTTIEGVTITLAEANTVWASIPDYTITAALDNEDAQTIYTLFNTQPAQAAVESEEGGCAGAGYCEDKDYGVYEDHFVCPITPVTSLEETTKSGLLLSFVDVALAANDKTTNLGAVAHPIGELSTFKETVPFETKNYTGDLIITEVNEKNFYDKVTALWTVYNDFLLGYIDRLKNNLSTLSPKFLKTALDSNGLTYEESPGDFLIPVGVLGGGVTVQAATFIFDPETRPITLPADSVDQYSGRLPYAYTLEYGKTGYTYYAIAKPSRELTYEATISRSYSFTRGLGKLTVTGTTGSGAAIPTGDRFEGLAIFNPIGTGAIALLNELHADITAAGLTINSCVTTPEAHTAYFIKDRALQSQLGYAGLTVRDQFGLEFTPDGLSVTYNVQLTDPPNTAGTITFRMYNSRVVAFDILNTVFNDVVHPDAYCAREQFISYSHPASFTRYSINGAILPSPNTPPAYSEAAVLAASLCGIGEEDRPKPTLYGMSISSVPSIVPTIDVVIDGTRFLVSENEAINFTFPDISFLLQAGTAAPYAITWKGAYIYDTHLKRWGKLKADYQQLLDFSPINSVAVGIIPYTNFGIQGALLDSNGFIQVFDAKPTDSYLKFGKYGNFRKGFTSLEEVRADFRQPCSGRIEVEPSFDGKTVDSAFVKNYDYNTAIQAIFGLGDDNALSAKWFNIAFKGHFDLSYLELTSWSASRR